MLTSDAALIQAIASGDRQALAGLYRSLEKPVYRFILSRLNDPFEAHDILHDVFLEVWRVAGSFEGRSAVKTWVMGIAYRKVIDRLRRAGRMDMPDEMPDSIDDAVDTEACIAASQEAVHLQHCLDQLTGDHRSAVTLVFYEDMGYGEVAAVIGVPEGTVKTRVFHAKKLLLRCLEGRIGWRGART
ncbi:MAG: sigma-70 family RNA polymerase sigma factor [bacterium]